MYVLYADESGRSGLYDASQPYHILGGLAFHDSEWTNIERELIAEIDAIVPQPRLPDWEIHMAHLFHGKGHFKAMPRSTRDDIVECVLNLFARHRMTLFMMVIDKAAHIARYYWPVPPAKLAYEFMIERFELYLHRQTDKVGMIVSDEQKGEEKTIRAAHESYRRRGTSQLRIDYVIETPFFVPSHNSWMIQIVDVATFWCNRYLRTRAAGGATPAPWVRLEPYLDRSPTGQVVGLKIFP
jgi:hypothetical protein